MPLQDCYTALYFLKYKPELLSQAVRVCTSWHRCAYMWSRIEQLEWTEFLPGDSPSIFAVRIEVCFAS
jgi:hypothetical protein